MALTAKQRNALPSSAFVYPKQRKYPVPTKAQAKRAGISERQRLRTHRNALSRAAQPQTSGSYSTVARKVKSRAGGKVASVKGRGGTSRPSTSSRKRRRTSASSRRRVTPRTSRRRGRRTRGSARRTRAFATRRR
jgi:hypothetical protein